MLRAAHSLRLIQATVRCGVVETPGHRLRSIAIVPFAHYYAHYIQCTVAIFSTGALLCTTAELGTKVLRRYGMDYRQRQYSLSTPLYHLGPPALLCLQAVRTMALLCLQTVGTAALLCLGSRHYGLTLPSGSRHRGLTLPRQSALRPYSASAVSTTALLCLQAVGTTALAHTTLWPYAVVHNPHTHSLTHTYLLTHLLSTVLSIPIPPVKHTHVGSDHCHYWVCTSAVLGTQSSEYIGKYKV